MKNKEFYKLLKKNKSNSNFGFTLTELLIGLFMSTFVIGALGFGVMQVLRATKSEGSRIEARNDTTRALDFISDEIKRAESVKTSGTGFTAESGVTATQVLALDLPGYSNDVTYYLRSNSNTPWKGPQVLYRWGPPLNIDGEYTANAWQHEALIDGIDNQTVAGVSSSCTGTVSPSTPKGFYACIEGTNTAQLYLVGQTDKANGISKESYIADTKAASRIKAKPSVTIDTSQLNSRALTSCTGNNCGLTVKGLGAEYACNVTTDANNNITGLTPWNMQTDFSSTKDDPNNPGTELETQKTTWIQESNVEAAYVEFDKSEKLKIKSSPSITSGTTCLSKNNQPEYTIDFSTGQESTFTNSNQTPTLKYVGSPGSENGAVIMLQNGDLISNIVLKDTTGASVTDSYSGNSTTLVDTKAYYGNDGFQKSLKTLLNDQGFINGADGSIKLKDNQRIIAFEVGQTNPDHPGFELQDNVFLMTSDAFKP